MSRPRLTFETLDAAGFAAARPEWDRLHRACGRPPFLSGGMLGAWCATHGQGRRIEVRTARAGDRIVAALPVMAGGPPRALVPLGEGIAGLAGSLVDPDLADPEAALAGLLGVPAGRYLRLEPLEEADARRLGTAAARAGLAHALRPVITARMAAVPDGWDAYLSGLSKNARRAFRRADKALGPLDWITSDSDPAGAVEGYIAVARTSWKTAAGSGVAGSEAGRAFLRALARDAPEAVHVAAATREGRPVCCTLAFTGGDALHLQAEEFDEAFAREGAGRYARMAAIRFAAGKGLRGCDMMRDSKVNRSICTEERPLYRLLVWRRGDPTRHLARVQGLARRLRRASAGGDTPRAAALKEAGR